MKLIDLFTPTVNKKTNQLGGTWKKKKLKQLGVTSEQLLTLSPQQLSKLLSIQPQSKLYKK